MLTVEFRSDHGPWRTAVVELAALWAELPDGPARKAAFRLAFERARVGEFAVHDEVVEGGIVTLRLRPGPLTEAALAEARAVVDRERGAA